jgi:ABC-type microcin C transport system duplicated ATPase subunit YejF
VAQAASRVHEGQETLSQRERGALIAEKLVIDVQPLILGEPNNCLLVEVQIGGLKFVAQVRDGEQLFLIFIVGDMNFVERLI